RTERLLPHCAGEICCLPEVPGRNRTEIAAVGKCQCYVTSLRRYRSAGLLHGFHPAVASKSTRHHETVSSGGKWADLLTSAHFSASAARAFEAFSADSTARAPSSRRSGGSSSATMSRMILAARAGSPGHVSTVDSRKRFIAP